jgi:hypothetical protein
MKIKSIHVFIVIAATVTSGNSGVTQVIAAENHTDCERAVFPQDLEKCELGKKTTKEILASTDLSSAIASEPVAPMTKELNVSFSRDFPDKKNIQYPNATEVNFLSGDTESTVPKHLQASKIINSISDFPEANLHENRNIYPQESIPETHKKSTLIAQNPPEITKKPLGWSALDFSTPSSPAAKIIGYTNDIGAISNPNELAVKLLTGLDSDGSFQTGFAIDIAPYLLARGTGFTLEEYRSPNSGFQRFLANTKISVATSKSDTTARFGVGAEFILLNEGDFRLDPELLEEFKGIVKDLPPFDSADPDYTAFNDSLKRKIQPAKNRARKKAAQKPIWSLGFATSLASTTGKYFDFKGDGTGLWTTYKTGLGGDSELILHGYYRSGERVPDRNVTGAFVDVDTLTTAVRIRTGSDNFKFSAETAYNFESQSGKTSNSYLSFGLGVEPKITDGLWLSLSMSGTTGKQSGNDVQIFSGLKWNFNSGN